MFTIDTRTDTPATDAYAAAQARLYPDVVAWDRAYCRWLVLTGRVPSRAAYATFARHAFPNGTPV